MKIIHLLLPIDNEFSRLLNLINKKTLFIKFLIFTSLHILLSFLFSKILLIFFKDNELTTGYKFRSINEEIFVSVFFAPLIETFVFQFIVLEIILRFFTTNIFYACIFSALIFSLIHLYSIAYFFHAIIAGFILSAAYLSADKKMHGFILVVFIHAFYNGFSSVINHCF